MCVCVCVWCNAPLSLMVRALHMALLQDQSPSAGLELHVSLCRGPSAKPCSADFSSSSVWGLEASFSKTGC